jgi:hypothetical protein
MFATMLIRMESVTSASIFGHHTELDYFIAESIPFVAPQLEDLHFSSDDSIHLWETQVSAWSYFSISYCSALPLRNSGSSL